MSSAAVAQPPAAAANGASKKDATVTGIVIDFHLPVAKEDEMQPVRAATPLPDLLPRSYDDIKRMRKLRKDAESGRKYVAPKRNLPAPYVNDDECDEFEDATIKTTVEYLADVVPSGFQFKLGGPAVEGEVTTVFDNGMLYKIITEDGSWCFYNDTEKYEMHVKFRFGAKSELQPGPNVDMFVKNNKELEATLVVYPRATEKLITGKVNGFKCMAKAQPLSEAKREEVYAKTNKESADELNRIAEFVGCTVDELDEGTVLDVCQKQDMPYIDCQFRPGDYSLFRSDVDTYRIQTLPWRRTEAYIAPDQRAEIRLFRRTILPSLVTQGDIGNTYLVSAMAAMADYPQRVHDLFRHPLSAGQAKQERTIGAYWVTINYNGWWCPVLLDEYLPGFPDGPEFARCARDLRRMWIPLLEKAYAKVHESYANIASGDPLEPLQDFTGYPITRFDQDWQAATDGDDALFMRMILYRKKGYMIMLYTPRDENTGSVEVTTVTTSTGAAGQRNSVLGESAMMTSTTIDTNTKRASAITSDLPFKAAGLNPHCGYTVLDVKHFDDHGLQMVKIRNPWGTGAQWTGRWGVEDKRWDNYPQVRSACYPEGNENAAEDNAFWLEWSDALKLFQGGGVCHVRSDWYDYRIRGEFQEGIPSVCLEINVAETMEAFIILSQCDERAVEAGDYAALLISVSRHGSKNEKVDCSSTTDVEAPDRMLKFNFARDVALRYTFKAEDSPYFVIPRIHDANVDKPYVIGLLMDTYAGNGNKIEFKKFDRGCKIFQNMPSFTVHGHMTDVAAEYQVRTPRQPIEEIGSELIDVRLNEFGMYDEV